MVTELGFDIKTVTKYPDLRRYGNIFERIKTPVCGYKVRECKDNGCNLFCKRQEGR